MKRLSLTKAFGLYREAARLTWNVFLADDEAREEEFFSLNPALFRAIVLSRLRNNASVATTVAGERYYSNIEIVPGEKSALLLKPEPTLNRWVEIKLSPNTALMYIDLFDWEQMSERARDFEFIRCRVARSDVADMVDEIVMVRTRTSKLYETLDNGC